MFVNVPTLNNRVTFLYKVVDGQVPALPCHDILEPIKGKRLIKAKAYKDCQTSNIVSNQETRNTKCFKTIQAKTEQFSNSFFPRTIKDWNKLEDRVVRAPSVTVFKTLLDKCY